MEIVVLIFVFANATKLGTAVGFEYQSPPPLYFKIATSCVYPMLEKQTIIKISGSNKQEVGSIASKIKSLRPPEPYKGKGIKEQGQYVLRKEGKKK